jgi:hypothetical protein
MKFEELYEKARKRGFTLSKAAKPTRAGKRPIRYVLEDNHNLLHFRSLVLALRPHQLTRALELFHAEFEKSVDDFGCADAGRCER